MARDELILSTSRRTVRPNVASLAFVQALQQDDKVSHVSTGCTMASDLAIGNANATRKRSTTCNEPFVQPLFAAQPHPVVLAGRRSIVGRRIVEQPVHGRVRLHGLRLAHSICMTTRDVLERMAALIRSGDAAAAAELGGSCQPSLAVSHSDISMGCKLGQGSESTIYAAEYREQQVAVKKYIIRGTADLQRYRNELAVLSSLQHSHVVPLLGARALAPGYTMIIPRYDCSLEVWVCLRGAASCRRAASHVMVKSA